MRQTCREIGDAEHGALGQSDQDEPVDGCSHGRNGFVPDAPRRNSEQSISDIADLQREARAVAVDEQ